MLKLRPILAAVSTAALATALVIHADTTRPVSSAPTPVAAAGSAEIL